jgi:hypothetical protein
MKKEVQEIQKLLQKLSEDKSEYVNFNIEAPVLPFEVGKSYFIRTVTHYYTGKLSDIVGKFLVLDDCAWIADTGRFMEAVKTGSFSEIEPMGNSVILNSDAVIDAIIAKFDLPLTQK